MTMTKKKPKSKKKKSIRRPATKKPKRYVPRECNACTALRPEGKLYAEVYSTFRRTDGVYRYCRCRYCQNTWMSVDRTH